MLEILNCFAQFIKGAFIITILLVLSYSCKVDKKKLPVDESKFQEILIDIHLLQAKMENYKSLNDTFFYATGKGYEEIFSKHKITQSEFSETFDFYLNNPKLMDKIYERITEKLSEEEAKAKK